MCPIIYARTPSQNTISPLRLSSLHLVQAGVSLSHNPAIWKPNPRTRCALTKYLAPVGRGAGREHCLGPVQTILPALCIGRQSLAASELRAGRAVHADV